MPISDLSHMVQIWGATLMDSGKHTKTELVQSLIPILQDPVRLWRMLIHLPKRSRGLLWTIQAAGGSLLVDQKLGYDLSSRVSLKSFPELITQGILAIYPDETKPKNLDLVVIPREIFLQLGLPPAYSDSLGELLSVLPMEDSNDGKNDTPSLWQVARNHQLEVRHTPAVLKELIRQTLLDKGYIQKLYQEKLSTSEQQLLKILSLKNCQLSLEELRREWLHFRWSVDLIDMRNLLDNLWRQGLVFLDVSGKEVSVKKAVIPREIGFIIQNNFMKEYRSPSEQRHTFYLKKSLPNRMDLGHDETCPSVMDDLILLLGYTLSEDVFLLGNDPNDPLSGRVHRKHWRRLLPHLKYQGEDGIDYFHFLFQFTRNEGIMGKRGDRLIYMGQGLPHFQDQFFLAARMLSFWLHFIDNNGQVLKNQQLLGCVSSRPDAEHLNRQSGHDGECPSIDDFFSIHWESRQSLLAFLATLSPQRWIDLDAFIDTLIQQESVMIESENHQTNAVNSEEIIYDIRQSLCMALRWIGIVRMAQTDDKEQKEFCVTDFGSALLKAEGEAIYQRQLYQETNFLALANLDIILPPDLHPEIRFRLCDFVELKGNHCVLTRDSIRRGLDNGWTEKSITEFLHVHSRSTPPENVIKFIKEVAERHGHIVIWANQGTIETRDAWLMTEIASRRTIKPYLIEQDKPHTARITPGKDPRRLLILLRKAGYFPRWMS